MSEKMVRVRINGMESDVAAGTTVAAAAWNAGVTAMRSSVTGQPRAALCGMGVCFECRITVDGVAHARSCQLVCHDGMEILTR